MSFDKPQDSKSDYRGCYIPIKIKTRARLQRRGRKDQTYDDLITELLDHAEAL